jgi:HNH endonuclease
MGLAKHPTERKRGTRHRTCIDCGLVETVRVDNPGVRCKSCGSKPGGTKSGAIRAAHANRVKCSGCGAELKRPPSNTGEENFCTPECAAKTRNVSRTCKQCGQPFTIWRTVAQGSTNATGNFCSRTCYDSWLLSGAEDKSHYVQMKGAKRDAVVEGKLCQRCGTPDGLEVHHVIPRRVGGEDNPENLIPLCKGCHKRIELLTCELIAGGIELDEIAERISSQLVYGPTFSQVR